MQVWFDALILSVEFVTSSLPLLYNIPLIPHQGILCSVLVDSALDKCLQQFLKCFRRQSIVGHRWSERESLRLLVSQQFFGWRNRMHSHVDEI